MTIAKTNATLTRILSLAALVLLGQAFRPEQQALSQAADADTPQGVEVLARGPIHEAYAEPAGGQTKPSPVVPKQPPDPIEEMPPDQKPDGDNVQWIAGYFAWDEEKADFMWVSGFWRTPPPGRQWMPGHWNQVDGGWQWAPGFWAAHQQQEVSYLPPPPAPIETGPSVPAPSADYVYVQGCWIYRDGHYVWRPGFWTGCRRGWVWVPSHYVWTPAGYVFIDGYWDYTLRERGMLFAPIYVDVTVCRRPGWYYSPCYVVHDECLFGAMFVRPGYGCYYFGDYFAPCHRDAGFVAWCDVRIGGGYCGDPLFCYYSYHYRSDPGWSVSLRAGYVGIYAGTIAPPPRTLIQQTTVVNNITVNNINNTTINRTVNNVNNVSNVNNTVNNVTNVRNNTTMLTSLKQVNKTDYNLKPVTPEARQTAKATAVQMVQAGQQRAQQEKQLLAMGPAPTKSTDAPRVAKMSLPNLPATPATGGAKSPPPSITPDSKTAKSMNAGQSGHPQNNVTPAGGNASHVGNANTPHVGNAAGTQQGTTAGQPNTGHAGQAPNAVHPDLKHGVNLPPPPPKTGPVHPKPPDSKTPPPPPKHDPKKDKDKDH
jgi:hypothetical protein